MKIIQGYPIWNFKGRGDSFLDPTTTLYSYMSRYYFYSFPSKTNNLLCSVTKLSRFVVGTLLFHRGRIHRRLDGRQVRLAEAPSRGLHHVQAEQADSKRGRQLRLSHTLC